MLVPVLYEQTVRTRCTTLPSEFHPQLKKLLTKAGRGSCSLRSPRRLPRYEPSFVELHVITQRGERNHLYLPRLCGHSTEYDDTQSGDSSKSDLPGPIGSCWGRGWRRGGRQGGVTHSAQEPPHCRFLDPRELS